VDNQRRKIAERSERDRAAERQALGPASHVPFIDVGNPAIPGYLTVDDENADPDSALSRASTPRQRPP
jgi:hypothetical protein